MKLADDSLVEILSIVTFGLAKGEDISELLRTIEFTLTDDMKLHLAESYTALAFDWKKLTGATEEKEGTD